MPYINGKFIYPIIVFGSMIILVVLTDNYFGDLFNYDFSGVADYTEGKVTFMDLAIPKISLIIFWLVCIILSIITIFKEYSLIPLMGVTTCLYLLTGMTKSNWVWFIGWLAIGLVIYFSYGYRKSKLAQH
jgi:basic amino acid/polyamine antiporter, APA family